MCHEGAKIAQLVGISIQLRHYTIFVWSYSNTLPGVNETELSDYTKNGKEQLLSLNLSQLWVNHYDLP